MSELASVMFSIADASEFRFARFYIVCGAVMLETLKSPPIVCGLQSVAKTQNLMPNAMRKKCSDFSPKNPPLPEAAGTIRCSDFLHNKTSPAFSVSVSARLRQICVTSGSAESAGSACQRAPPRLCPAGAPFLRSWSSACSCSCPARTERNKYFSYS